MVLSMDRACTGDDCGRATVPYVTGGRYRFFEWPGA